MGWVRMGLQGKDFSLKSIALSVGLGRVFSRRELVLSSQGAAAEEGGHGPASNPP
jgi:hypothetical protein